MNRAFARIHADLPKARLVVIGSDYGKGIQRNLEALCRKLDVSGGIQFVEIRHDIPRFMQLSSVYVNASLYEGMSNTILETMAAGCPVIATQVGGNPVLVADQVTGYLFEHKDDLQLSERLRELLLNSDMAKKMGSAGENGLSKTIL